MKPTRSTDNLLRHAEESDFIVRKQPLVLQLFAMFAIAFLVIYFTASIMNDIGSKKLFFFTLLLVIGSLGWFTVIYTTRHRDLVLATEFMNAMLASAAQLSTRFCLITKRDGSIVYIDSGFQKLFPHFMQRSRRTVDALLSSSGVSREILQRVTEVLQLGKTDRIVLPLLDASGKPMTMMVTIDVLPRPKGYFLFRGRDYVEKRNTQKNESEMQQALLLAQALYTLPAGVMITDSNHTVIYANQALEEGLGYGPGEIRGLNLEHVCYQYAGYSPGQSFPDHFNGRVSLLRKDRGLISASAHQTMLSENGNLLGLSTLLLFTTTAAAKR